MRNVVLFEPDASGHRMVFVRYIVEAMARRGGIRATLVTSRRAQETDWVRAMQDSLRSYLSFHPFDDPVPPRGIFRLSAKMARQFGYTQALKAAVGDLRTAVPVDHVLVPFVDDYCLFPFALQPEPFGRLSWSGIAIRPRFHLARMGAKVPPRKEDHLEAWAYSRLLRSRSLDTLFSIDPSLSGFLAHPRVVTTCDPADMVEAAVDPNLLPVAGDAVVLLVYGHIDHRKAVDRLLKLAADPRMPASLVIALVGVQAEDMAPVLHGPPAKGLRANGRLVEIARRVSDAEEAAVFTRADIVWGYYPGSYCSSGAMVRAGRTRHPLIATEEGLVGLLTRQYGSGLTAAEEDDEALLRQLVRLVGDPDLRRKLGNAGNANFNQATGAAFGDQIVQRLVSAPSRF